MSSGFIFFLWLGAAARIVSYAFGEDKRLHHNSLPGIPGSDLRQGLRGHSSGLAAGTIAKCLIL
jgi:hypothetical protein